MRGLVLYAVTLLMESASVLVRFVLVSLLALLLFDQPLALVIGGIAAFGPIIGSFAVLAGMPSGHLFVRHNLGARAMTSAEQTRLEQVLAPLRAQGIAVPRYIYTVPESGLNAAVSGRTLYIFHELFQSRFLPSVVAHELGHYNSLDGRLLLALRSLTIPGGFLIVYVLLQLLHWLAYVLALALSGLLLIVFFFLRIRIAPAVAAVFHIVLLALRLVIIFAVGGVGPALLGSFWRSHFVDREFAADAYAVRLGYGKDLVDFFGRHALQDVTIPWYEHPTHPPADQRINRIERVMATPPGTPPPRLRVPTVTGARPAQSSLVLIVLGLVALGLVGALLLGTMPLGNAAPALPVPPGPTPTLGLPGL